MYSDGRSQAVANRPIADLGVTPAFADGLERSGKSARQDAFVMRTMNLT